jgi:hypothetical protein
VHTPAKSRWLALIVGVAQKAIRKPSISGWRQKRYR